MAATTMEVNAAGFQTEVLEKSSTTAVLVDFWAPWCAPCRALGPILDRVVKDYAGRLMLAKVNVDESTELASQYGVRGIPDVKLFSKGKIVGEFSGVVPEQKLRDFLDRLVPDETEALRVSANEASDAGDADAAIFLLEQALAKDSGRLSVRIHLADLLLLAGQIEQAETVIQAVPERERDARCESVMERIQFLRNAQSLPTADELKTALKEAPDDLEVRFKMG